MGYQRAQWHSGLTYRQTCEECRTIVEYKDDKLGFRPWFPDGFVYCPKCNKPLRHHEEYAIDRPVEQTVIEVTQPANPPEPAPAPAPAPAPEPTPAPAGEFKSKFCYNCGHAFEENQVFCIECGTKRI